MKIKIIKSHKSGLVKGQKAIVENWVGLDLIAKGIAIEDEPEVITPKAKK